MNKLDITPTTVGYMHAAWKEPSLKDTTDKCKFMVLERRMTRLEEQVAKLKKKYKLLAKQMGS